MVTYVHKGWCYLLNISRENIYIVPRLVIMSIVEHALHTEHCPLGIASFVRRALPARPCAWVLDLPIKGASWGAVLPGLGGGKVEDV